MNREKRNKIIFGMFIIFLMISSTAGFIYSGSDSKKINGFKFTNTGTGWQTWIENINSYVFFTYLPNELNWNPDELIFTNNIKIINENWDQNKIQRFQTVLLFGNVNVELVEEIPDCESDNYIILKHSFENAKLIKESKCFYLEGSSSEFIDGVTYKIFGVI